MRQGVWVYERSGSPFSPAALLVRFLINLLGLWVADLLVPGIVIDDFEALFFGTIIFAAVNMLLRPLATFFTFCLIILTFGLFVLIINTALLATTAWLAGQFDLAFTIDGFWSAFFGALLISIVSLVASTFVRTR